jgi:AP-1-like factor
MSLFGSPPSATSSATASTHDSPQSLFVNEKNGGGGNGTNDFTNVNGVNAPVSFFDRQSSEHTATADAMGLDFGFGPVFSHTPYTTIASNPMFMSFREPDSASFPMDATPMGGAVPNSNPAFGANGNNGNNGGGMAFGWPDVNMSMLDNLQAFDYTNSLDELFGGATMNNNGPLDYQQYKNNNFSASQSPVSHQNGKSSTSTSTNSSSPNIPQQQQQQQSPNVQSLHQPNTNANHLESSSPCANGSCPSTKGDLAGIIAKDQGSMFVAKSSPPVSSPSPSLSCGTPTSPPNPSVDSTTNTANTTTNTPGSGTGSFVPCSNLQLPKTVKSDQNVEVMSAWKIIQANPKFQDVDINDLCAEFASKARCDGSQVVIEPDGMKQILEAVSRKAGGGVNGVGVGVNGVGVGVGQQ